MWKAKGIMPSELAKQAPGHIFLILDSYDEPEDDEELSPHLKMFYGL